MVSLHVVASAQESTTEAFASLATAITIDAHGIAYVGRNVVKCLADEIGREMATSVGVLDYAYGAQPPPVGNQFEAVCTKRILQTEAHLLIILVFSINPE